jgi:hypothetical protein
MTTLPEIGVARNREHYASWGADALAFPPQCPCCGAELQSSSEWEAHYICGAKYSPKPQCQTHTDVWWGQCPKE